MVSSVLDLHFVELKAAVADLDAALALVPSPWRDPAEFPWGYLTSIRADAREVLKVLGLSKAEVRTYLKKHDRFLFHINDTAKWAAYHANTPTGKEAANLFVRLCRQVYDGLGHFGGYCCCDYRKELAEEAQKHGDREGDGREDDGGGDGNTENPEEPPWEERCEADGEEWEELYHPNHWMHDWRNRSRADARKVLELLPQCYGEGTPEERVAVFAEVEAAMNEAEVIRQRLLTTRTRIEKRVQLIELTKELS